METPTIPIKRILMLADFACATGFAQVAQNITRQLLLDKTSSYQIDIVGINYHGMPTEWHDIYPQVRLFPAMITSNGDVFGRQGYLNLLATGQYDLSFVLQDTFNIEVIGDAIVDIRNKLAGANKKVFKLIFYFPIDATPKENWLTKSALIADIPVVYTQYGYDESVKIVPALKNRLQIMPHGVEDKIFYPLPEEDRKKFRHDYFAGLADDCFLITNVNRNQPRKDVARTMKIFADYKAIDGTALLYLHMKNVDVAYTIDEVARSFGLIPKKDYITPQNFNEHDGFPVDVVNYIYNASDVVMTTSLGEGWGLSITEAMAAGVPIVAPRHTALTEILGEDRGHLVTAGKTSNDWVMLQNDNERLRPLVNIPEFVDALTFIKQNKAKALEQAARAREYLLAHWTWDIVGARWQQIFKQAGIVEKKVKIGRNDPCFCGSEKKYKNCHLNG